MAGEPSCLVPPEGSDIRRYGTFLVSPMLHARHGRGVLPASSDVVEYTVEHLMHLS